MSVGGWRTTRDGEQGDEVAARERERQAGKQERAPERVKRVIAMIIMSSSSRKARKQEADTDTDRQRDV